MHPAKKIVEMAEHLAFSYETICLTTKFITVPEPGCGLKSFEFDLDCPNTFRINESGTNMQCNHQLISKGGEKINSLTFIFMIVWCLFKQEHPESKDIDIDNRTLDFMKQYFPFFYQKLGLFVKDFIICTSTNPDQDYVNDRIEQIKQYLKLP